MSDDDNPTKNVGGATLLIQNKKGIINYGTY